MDTVSAGQPAETYNKQISKLLSTDEVGMSAKQIEEMKKNKKEWNKRVADFGK